ncbi:ribonuclease H-like domain-containing protein [Xanthomonas sp. NCPPB 2632]|uniref:ribonuclease H-like domain-containing protein n=1 Tax=Xanthomonas sp. NCPPB 2632 TaxID=3240912 RepID=UPI0035199FC0
MNDLAARLRALRQQAGIRDGVAGTRTPGGDAARGRSVTPAPTAVPSMARPAVDLAALRRMAGVRERIAQPREPLRTYTREVPGDELSPGLRYLEQRFGGHEPPDTYDLGFARLDVASKEHLLHFDTETTGLAGGTGTRAFMIGAADWHEGRLRVRQLYITALSAEAAMLKTFATWIGQDTVLVSYNGKSYDAPLLATRYRLARLANPLAGLRHVDLLHPMRRRYRHDWENCKMQTAERRLLSIVREDDLPGSEAPRAWLTYLRGGASTNLVRVAEHNLQDVRSLSGLLVHAHGWAARDALAISPPHDEK